MGEVFAILLVLIGRIDPGDGVVMGESVMTVERISAHDSTVSGGENSGDCDLDNNGLDQQASGEGE